MKLLILGNHTCGNRGDSAILRGLLDAINYLQPEAQVDVMSRYPVSSSWLLNRPVMGDPLFLQMKQHNSAAGVMGRVKKSASSSLSTPGAAFPGNRHWQTA
ncbi:extracellular polysaccharide biosynthesis protein [Salmonella bongori]|nr:extracellular polysaccharide biosynthesis protein [Salmonella bongori]